MSKSQVVCIIYLSIGEIFYLFAKFSVIDYSSEIRIKQILNKGIEMNNKHIISGIVLSSVIALNSHTSLATTTNDANVKPAALPAASAGPSKQDFDKLQGQIQAVQKYVNTQLQQMVGQVDRQFKDLQGQLPGLQKTLSDQVQALDNKVQKQMQAMQGTLQKQMQQLQAEINKVKADAAKANGGKQ